MKTYTELELKDILEKHSLWLREDSNGVRANLRKADLSWTYLSGADLSEADLRGVDLSEANLSGTNLYGVYPREADLDGAKGINHSTT